MSVIAHISDLHFGAEDPVVAEGLVDDLTLLKPALVVNSGDLTQRARSSQFEAARRLLARIAFPQLTIPGNHDIPLFDLFTRFVRPLERYKRYITEDLSPVYRNEEFAVLGVNTARSFTWKNGRLSLEQIEQIRQTLCALPPQLFKIVVTHHPFVPPPDDRTPALVGRGRLAIDVMDQCGADMLLAGHLHRHYQADVRTHYVKAQRTIMVAQAGTAISRRRRGGEANAYNVITLMWPQVQLHVRAWTGMRFEPLVATRYINIGGRWTKQE